MIKHWLTVDKQYLCNQACGTTKEKIAVNPNEVTCKNCLRRMRYADAIQYSRDMWMKR